MLQALQSAMADRPTLAKMSFIYPLSVRICSRKFVLTFDLRIHGHGNRVDYSPRADLVPCMWPVHDQKGEVCHKFGLFNRVDFVCQ